MVLYLKSSPDAFKRRTQSKVISSWIILRTLSAVRSEDTVERFRTSVDMKRNHIANEWAKHYVCIVVSKMRVLFDTARVRSKYKDGCDGQQTFF